MGKHAKEPWQLRQPGGPGTTVYMRFSFGGRQHELSTGARDFAEAKKAAPHRYAETVSGRRAPRPIAEAFDKLVARWIAEYEKDHAAGTAETVTMYAHAHWLPYFGDLSHVTKESVSDYTRERLTHVTRATVRKELSALRRFAAWAGLDVEIPGLPRHGFPGRRHKQARKPKALVLSPKQIEKIIAAMPERDGDAWVRPFFRVLWETGLRQSTVFALEVPKHYKRGAASLFIGRDIDKAHAERDLPLSPAAREALDAASPDVGRIFPAFDLRTPLRRACTKAKTPQISPYDLRHARLSAWANAGGPLTGVQYAAGHASLATTARYVQANRDAALRVILGGLLGGAAPEKLSHGQGRSRNQQKTRGAKGGT